MLERILKKYGIQIKNADGSFRMMVDVLEDMYLKLNAREMQHMFFEMSEDEKYANIFDDSRGRSYKGVK